MRQFYSLIHTAGLMHSGTSPGQTISAKKGKLCGSDKSFLHTNGNQKTNFAMIGD